MGKVRRKNAQKVVVAMSGGIDSAVAAALLKSAGYEAAGIFMKLADFPQLKEAERRARKVAETLKIPFYVFNLREEFKKKIISYFLNGYKKGITPNPCVVCNKEVKFGLLLERALKLNADYIATGHYARKKGVWNKELGIKEFKLLKAKDKERDQSYFLWQLNQKQLKRILFPIGDYTRAEVEKLAKKFKSPVIGARKSVEICFIQTTIDDFFKKYLKSRPGEIISEKGKIVGKHKGVWFYTVGQRKGIGLPGGPYYVLDKNLNKNTLIVTKNEKDLHKKELLVKNVSWISGKEPKLPLEVKVKIRYRHAPALAIITKKPRTKNYKLFFKKSQRAVTPGQSAVFYKGDEVVGGGIIR